jgi:hypothetical protein
MHPIPRAFTIAALAASASACNSPALHSKVTNAAIGTGLAVAAAGINRAATHECWAACRPGTVCDRRSGLCVEASSPVPAPDAGRPLPAPEGASYPPDHEYEVPP